MLGKIISNLLGRIYFSKKFDSWQIAKKNSSGYDDYKIFNQIKNIYTNKINNSGFHEFYERDGLLFKQKINDSELLFFLKKILKKKKNLNILDFGGSLGSIYFSNYNFINKNINGWYIVEQKHFVDFGNKLFKKKNFTFYKSIEECLKKKKINVAIFSGSLQYTEKPYKVLKKITKSKIDHILLHGIPFNKTKEDQYRVQYVPKKIYDASYPITIFSFNLFNSFLKKNNYKILSTINLRNQFYNIKFKSIIIQKM